MVGWLVFNDSTREKDDMTVGVGHSRRYCNTGYDQSQGRRPSTLKCSGSISQRRYRAPTIQSEINPKTGQPVGREAMVAPGGNVQYRADQSLTETIIAKRSLPSPRIVMNYFQN